jgi:hypothetical protein
MASSSGVKPWPSTGPAWKRRQRREGSHEIERRGAKRRDLRWFMGTASGMVRERHPPTV